MAQTEPLDKNAEIVSRYTRDVFNGRDYDLLSEIQTEDYIQHGPMPGMEIRGTAESLEVLKMFHGAFSDVEAAEELIFADGEYVCSMLTYTGTHDGELMGIPPTNKTATVRGIVVNRVVDGKIAEAWPLVDFLGLLQQVEVIPELDEIAA